jgi:hypothetical protein
VAVGRRGSHGCGRASNVNLVAFAQRAYECATLGDIKSSPLRPEGKEGLSVCCCSMYLYATWCRQVSPEGGTTTARGQKDWPC